MLGFNFDPSYKDEVEKFMNTNKKYSFFKKIFLGTLIMGILSLTFMTFGPNTFAKENELDYNWNSLLGKGSLAGGETSLGSNGLVNGYEQTTLEKVDTSSDFYYSEDGTAYKLLYYTWKTSQGDAVTENGNNLVGVYAPIDTIAFDSHADGTNYFSNGKTYSYYSLYSYLTDYIITGDEKYIAINDAMSSDDENTIQDTFYSFLSSQDLFTDSTGDGVSIDAYYKYVNGANTNNINELDKYYNVFPITEIKTAYIYNDGSYRYGTPYSTGNDKSNGTIYADEKEYELEVASLETINYFETEDGTKIYVGSDEWNDSYKISYYSNGSLKVWFDELNGYYVFSIQDLQTINYLSKEEVDDLTKNEQGGSSFITYDNQNGLIVKIKKELPLIQTAYKLVKEENVQPIFVKEDADLSPVTSGNTYTYYNVSRVSENMIPSYYTVDVEYAFRFYASEAKNLFEYQLTQMLYNYDEEIDSNDIETKIRLKDKKQTFEYNVENNGECILLSNNISLKEDSVYGVINEKLDKYKYLNKNSEITTTINYYDLSKATDSTLIADYRILPQQTIYKKADGSFDNGTYYFDNNSNTNFKNKNEITMQKYNFSLDAYNWIDSSYYSVNYNTNNTSSYDDNTRLNNRNNAILSSKDSNTSINYYSYSNDYFSYNDSMENNGKIGFDKIVKNSNISGVTKSKAEHKYPKYYQYTHSLYNYTKKTYEDYYVLNFDVDINGSSYYMSLAFDKDAYSKYSTQINNLKNLTSYTTVLGTTETTLYIKGTFSTFFDANTFSWSNDSWFWGGGTHTEESDVWFKGGIDGVKFNFFNTYSSYYNNNNKIQNFTSKSSQFISGKEAKANWEKGWKFIGIGDWSIKNWFDWCVKLKFKSAIMGQEEKIISSKTDQESVPSNSKTSTTSNGQTFNVITKYVNIKETKKYDIYSLKHRYKNYKVDVTANNSSQLSTLDSTSKSILDLNGNVATDKYNKMVSLYNVIHDNSISNELYYYNRTWYYQLNNGTYKPLEYNLPSPDEIKSWKNDSSSQKNSLTAFEYTNNRTKGILFDLKVTGPTTVNSNEYTTSLPNKTNEDYIIINLKDLKSDGINIFKDTFSNSQLDDLKEKIKQKLELESFYGENSVTIEENTLDYTCYNGEEMIKKFTFAINKRDDGSCDISFTLLFNRYYSAKIYQGVVDNSERNVINPNICKAEKKKYSNEEEVQEDYTDITKLDKEKNTNNIIFTSNDVDIDRTYTVNVKALFNTHTFKNISAHTGETVKVYSLIKENEIDSLTQEDIFNKIVLNENAYLASFNNSVIFNVQLLKYSDNPTNATYGKKSYVLDTEYYKNLGLFGDNVKAYYTFKIESEDYPNTDFNNIEEVLANINFEDDSYILPIIKANFGEEATRYTGLNDDSYELIENSHEVLSSTPYYKVNKYTITFNKVLNDEVTKTIAYGDTSNELSQNNNSAIYGYYKNAWVKEDGTFGYDTDSFEKYVQEDNLTSSAKINLFNQNDWFLKLNNSNLIKDINENGEFTFKAIRNTSLTISLDVSSANIYYLGYKMNGRYYHDVFEGTFEIELYKDSTLTLSDMYVMTKENFNNQAKKGLENYYVSYVDLKTTTENSVEKFKQTYLKRDVNYYKWSEVKDLPEYIAKYASLNKENVKTQITGYLGMYRDGQIAIITESDLIKYSNSYDINYGNILYTIKYKYNDSYNTLIDNLTEKEIGEYIYGIDGDNDEKILFRYSLKNIKENLYFETEKDYQMIYNQTNSSYILSSVNDINKISKIKGITNPDNYENYYYDSITGLYYSLDEVYGRMLAIKNYVNTYKVDYVQANGNTAQTDYKVIFNELNNQFYIVNNFVNSVNGQPVEYIKYNVYVDKNKDKNSLIEVTVNGSTYKTYKKFDNAYTTLVEILDEDELNKYFDVNNTDEIKKYFVVGVSKNNFERLNTQRLTLKYEYNNSTNRMQLILKDASGNLLGTIDNNVTFDFFNKAFLISDAEYEVFNELCNSKYKFKLNENGLVFEEYGLYYDQGYYVEGSYLGVNPTEIDDEIKGYYYTIEENSHYSIQTQNQTIEGLYSKDKYAYIETDKIIYLTPEGKWTTESTSTYPYTEVIKYTENVDVVIGYKYYYRYATYENSLLGFFGKWVWRDWMECSESEYYSYASKEKPKSNLLGGYSSDDIWYDVKKEKITETRQIEKSKTVTKNRIIENIPLTNISSQIDLSANQNTINYKDKTYIINDLFKIIEQDIPVYKLYTSKIKSIKLADVTDTDIIDLTQINDTSGISVNNTYRLRWDGGTAPNTSNYSYYANSSFNIFDEETNEYIYSDRNIYKLNKIYTDKNFYNLTQINSACRQYLVNLYETLKQDNVEDKFDWSSMMYGSFYGLQVNTQANGFTAFVEDAISAFASLFGNKENSNKKTHPIGYMDLGEFFDNSVSANAGYNLYAQISKLEKKDRITSAEDALRLICYLNVLDINSTNSASLTPDVLYFKYLEFKEKCKAMGFEAFKKSDKYDSFFENITNLTDVQEKLKTLFKTLYSFDCYISGNYTFSKMIVDTFFPNIDSFTVFVLGNKNTSVDGLNKDFDSSLSKSEQINFLHLFLLTAGFLGTDVKASTVTAFLNQFYKDIKASKVLKDEQKTKYINYVSILLNNYIFATSSAGFSYQKEYTIKYYKTLFEKITNPAPISPKNMKRILNTFFDIDINEKYDWQKIHQVYEFVLNYTAENPDINTTDVLVLNNENSKLIYYKVNGLTPNNVVQHYYRTDDGFAYNEYFNNNDTTQITLEQVFSGHGHKVLKYDITENVQEMLINQLGTTGKAENYDGNYMKVGNYYMETWLSSPEFLHAFILTKISDTKNFFLITNYNVNGLNSDNVTISGSVKKDPTTADLKVLTNVYTEYNMLIDDFYIQKNSLSNATYQGGNIHPIGVAKQNTYSYNDTYFDLNSISNINGDTIASLVNLSFYDYELANFNDEKQKIMSAILTNPSLTIEQFLDNNTYYYLDESHVMQKYPSFESFEELYSSIVAGKVYIKKASTYSNANENNFYKSLPKAKVYYYSYNELDVSKCAMKIMCVGITTPVDFDPSSTKNAMLKTWTNTFKVNDDDFDSNVWKNNVEDFLGNGYYTSSMSAIALYTNMNPVNPFVLTKVGVITSSKTGLSTSSLINSSSKYYQDTTRIQLDISQNYYFITKNNRILSNTRIDVKESILETIKNNIDQNTGTINLTYSEGNLVLYQKNVQPEAKNLTLTTRPELVIEYKLENSNIVYGKKLLSEDGLIYLKDNTFTQDEIKYTIQRINFESNYAKIGNTTATAIQYDKLGNVILSIDKVKNKVTKAYFAIISYEKDNVTHNLLAVISNVEEYNRDIFLNDKEHYTIDSNDYVIPVQKTVDFSNAKILSSWEIGYGYIYKKDGKTIYAQDELINANLYLSSNNFRADPANFVYTFNIGGSSSKTLTINKNFDDEEYDIFEYNNITDSFKENSLKLEVTYKNSYNSITKIINLQKDFFNLTKDPIEGARKAILKYIDSNGNEKTITVKDNTNTVYKSPFSLLITNRAYQEFKDISNIETTPENFQKYIYGYSAIINNNLKGNRIKINDGIDFNDINGLDPVMQINIDANKINGYEITDVDKIVKDEDFREEKTSFDLTIKTDNKFNDPFYYVLSFTTNYEIYSTPVNYVKTETEDGIVYYFDGTDEENKTVSNKKVPYLISKCKTDNANNKNYLFNNANKKAIYNLNYNFDANEIKISSLVGSANYSLKIYNIFGQFIKEITFTTAEDLVYNPYGKFFDKETNPDNYNLLNPAMDSDELLLANEQIPVSLKQVLFSAGDEALEKFTKGDGTQYHIRDQFRLTLPKTISNIKAISIKVNFEDKSDNQVNHGITLKVKFDGNVNEKTYTAVNDIITIPYSDIKSLLNKYNANNDIVISKEELENFIEQEIIVKGNFIALNVPKNNQNVSLESYISYNSNFLFLDLDQNNVLTTKMETEFNNKNQFRNYDGYLIPNENSVKFDLGMTAGFYTVTTKELTLAGTNTLCYMPRAIGDMINKYYDGFVFVKASQGYKLYAYSNKEQGKIVS